MGIYDSRSSKTADFEWVLGPSGYLEPKTKTFRFLGLSTAVHVITAASFLIASSTLNLEQMGTSEGTLEVELLGEAAPAMISEQTEDGSSDFEAPAQTSAPSSVPTPLPQAQTPILPTEPSITEAPPSENIQNSMSENLNTPQLAVAPLSSQDTITEASTEDLSQEIDSNLQVTDDSSEAEIMKAKSALAAEAKALMEQKEKEIAQAKAESERLKAAQLKREQELKKSQAAKAAALALAASQAEAAKAKASGETSNEARTEEEQGARTAPISGTKVGSTATTIGGTESADPRGVRSLGDLRQIPGNPRPQYSYEERMNRIEGEVIFHAFVTPDGTLKDFKILQSSGYRSLDGKTLSALKKWKFYPNQSGWVKIPFVWTLKGEAESADGLLKTTDRTGGQWDGAVIDRNENEPLRWKESSGGLRETWE